MHWELFIFACLIKNGWVEVEKTVFKGFALFWSYIRSYIMLLKLYDSLRPIFWKIFVVPCFDYLAISTDCNAVELVYLQGDAFEHDIGHRKSIWHHWWSQVNALVPRFACFSCFLSSLLIRIPCILIVVLCPGWSQMYLSCVLLKGYVHTENDGTVDAVKHGGDNDTVICIKILVAVLVLLVFFWTW